jgi:hypothetical protein
MNAQTLALIFLAQAGYVFLLTVQQANVHRRKYTWAFFNSFAIGLCQLAALWFIPHATAAIEFAAFLLAGPVAVVVGMRFHPPVKSADPVKHCTCVSNPQKVCEIHDYPCGCSRQDGFCGH